MKSLFAFLLFSAIPAIASVSSICGFWVVPDSDTGKPESIAYVYEYKNLYYCRKVAIYDEDSGKIEETFLAPKEKAEGIPGNPYICGLDFIWGLAAGQSGKYSGNVINPSNGNVYNCQVWYDSSAKKLAVRGQWWLFGETEYWLPISPDKLPENIVSSVGKFVPKIPNTSNNSWLF